MLYNSFSKRVHAHDLLLLWQVLARAGGTLFPGEGPKLQTSWLLQSCTENRGSGSHSSSYWFRCFHFLVQKLGTPWVACRHLNSFLILWSLLSENGKMPSGPSSFEMAEKFREFSAPLPSRRSLYLGQSQMGMCFKLPNPLADVRCDHFRQAGLCHGKPRGPKLENWFLFLVSDVPTTPSPASHWSGLCTFFRSAGECNPQSGRAQAASGNSMNDF